MLINSLLNNLTLSLHEACNYVDKAKGSGQLPGSSNCLKEISSLTAQSLLALGNDVTSAASLFFYYCRRRNDLLFRPL